MRNQMLRRETHVRRGKKGSFIKGWQRPASYSKEQGLGLNWPSAECRKLPKGMVSVPGRGKSSLVLL